MAGGAPLPRNLFLNLTLLVLLLVVVLYAAARNITRPLSDLARAADSVGRQVRPAQLQERGARELRDAAHAFNTMQDRLRRYLDSRTRVLAAMSHDLKTPLTRLRLQVETLEDAALQARISRELDEMESMVHEALSLFRGLDDGEAPVAVDVNALLTQLRGEFADMGGEVTVSGGALRPFTGRAQALKRCLTNLIANAIKFGTRADVSVADSEQELLIRVRDRGAGIPEGELERVFEPFYRVESSRNRDSGGTGLGLSIARDIAQAHAGTLTLANLPGGGLEATLQLPRRA
jgi:signal transduction histidine kinase